MSRSLINTSLFLNHSTSESKDDAGSGIEDPSLTGIEDSSLTGESDIANYEKVSDKDDLYIIRHDDKSFYLHRQRLIDTVKQLYAYKHVQISQLEKHQAKLFESTIEATRILYNSHVLKKLILEDIQKIFKNVKTSAPGSVSAFFLACFNDDNFQGPLGCNPRCAASSLGCEAFDCEDTILVYSNGQFNALNEKQTSHAYIYIESDKFVKFNHLDVQRLKGAQISSVTIIYGNKDGTYRDITYRLNLDQLHTHHQNNSASSATIILVIIILLIILALVFLYGNHYMNFI